MSDPIDVDNEGNPLTLMDVISIDDTVTDEIDLKIRVEQLYAFLERMKESREKEILVLRYGLYGNDYHTQRQVAKRLGISRSYVSLLDYCKQHSKSPINKALHVQFFISRRYSSCLTKAKSEQIAQIRPKNTKRPFTFLFLICGTSPGPFLLNWFRA